MLIPTTESLTQCDDLVFCNYGNFETMLNFFVCVVNFSLHMVVILYGCFYCGLYIISLKSFILFLRW